MIRKLSKNEPPPNQVLNVVLVFYVIYILFLTLRPFDFSLENLKIFWENPRRSLFEFNFFDMVGNVFMFIPFGALLTAFIERRPHAPSLVLTAVTASGMLLSGSVETVQLFLDRSPNVSDVMTNTTGTIIGCSMGLARLRDKRSAQTGISLFQSRPLRLGVILIYSVILIGILFAPLKDNKIDIWRKNYHFVLGNERTKDRPWLGSMHSLMIFDRNLSAHEIYDLASMSKNGIDATSISSLSPVLAYGCAEGAGDILHNMSSDSCHLKIPAEGVEWSKRTPGIEFSGGVIQNRDVSQFLIPRLQKNNRFTVALWMKSKSIDQKGPARIVSSSPNVRGRNFTLAQQDSTFHFRVRSKLLGWNGSRPPLVTGPVLKDTLYHHVALTFTPAATVFYFDGLRSGRGLSLFRDYLPIRFVLTNTWLRWLASFTVLLLPLTLLIYHLLKSWRFWGSCVLISFYSLILEGLCDLLHGQPMSGETILPALLTVGLAKLSDFYFHPVRHHEPD